MQTYDPFLDGTEVNDDVQMGRMGSNNFVGYADADSSNTFPFVRGAEVPVAETRAVNRALRKA